MQCRFWTGNSELQKRQQLYYVYFVNVCVYIVVWIFSSADNLIIFRQIVITCLRCGFVRQVVTIKITKSVEMNKRARRWKCVDEKKSWICKHSFMLYSFSLADSENWFKVYLIYHCENWFVIYNCEDEKKSWLCIIHLCSLSPLQLP